MIKLPDGFDASALANELFVFSVPVIEIAMVVACGFLIIGILRRG